MSKAQDRAMRAKALLEYDAFNEICGDIQAEAQVLFMNPNSGMEEWTRANIMVMAVETFRNAINARIADAKLEDKRKAQDRASD